MQLCAHTNVLIKCVIDYVFDTWKRLRFLSFANHASLHSWKIHQKTELQIISFFSSPEIFNSPGFVFMQYKETIPDLKYGT
jgi:hypothetical protein